MLKHLPNHFDARLIGKSDEVVDFLVRCCGWTDEELGFNGGVEEDLAFVKYLENVGYLFGDVSFAQEESSSSSADTSSEVESDALEDEEQEAMETKAMIDEKVSTPRGSPNQFDTI